MCIYIYSRAQVSVCQKPHSSEYYPSLLQKKPSLSRWKPLFSWTRFFIILIYIENEIRSRASLGTRRTDFPTPNLYSRQWVFQGVVRSSNVNDLAFSPEWPLFHAACLPSRLRHTLRDGDCFRMIRSILFVIIVLRFIAMHAQPQPAMVTNHTTTCTRFMLNSEFLHFLCSRRSSRFLLRNDEQGQHVMHQIFRSCWWAIGLPTIRCKAT